MAEGETDLAERGWIVMHPKYPNGFKHFLDGQMPQQSTDDTIFLNVRLKGQPIPSPVPLVLPPGIVCWEKDDVWACTLCLAEVVAFIFAEERTSGDSTSIITSTCPGSAGSAALTAFRERTRVKRPLALQLDCGRCALPAMSAALCNCRAFATGQDAAVLDAEENAKWNQTALAARFGGAVPFDLKIDRSTDYRCKRADIILVAHINEFLETYMSRSKCIADGSSLAHTLDSSLSIENHEAFALLTYYDDDSDCRRRYERLLDKLLGKEGLNWADVTDQSNCADRWPLVRVVAVRRSRTRSHGDFKNRNTPGGNGDSMSHEMTLLTLEDSENLVMYTPHEFEKRFPGCDDRHHSRASSKHKPIIIVRRKLLVIGDACVGKTSLIEVVVRDTYPKAYIMTAWVNLSVKRIVDETSGATVEFFIYDIAGESVFPPPADDNSPYFKDADAALVVYDVANMQSFESATKWLQRVRQQVPCCVLVANKVDLRDHDDNDSSRRGVVTKAMGEQIAKQLDLSYFETSALSRSGISGPFEFLARKFADDAGDQRHSHLQFT